MPDSCVDSNKVQMIPFTQYLLPSGRVRSVEIIRPKPIEEMAQALLKHGCKFEIEMLQTGEISMEVMYGEQPVAGEICANGPAVPLAVDAMVRNALSSFTKAKSPARSDE